MSKNVTSGDSCPHCPGIKQITTTTTLYNPYPQTQQIIGPGAKDQLKEMTSVTIHCSLCKTLFIE